MDLGGKLWMVVNAVQHSLGTVAPIDESIGLGVVGLKGLFPLEVFSQLGLIHKVIAILFNLVLCSISYG